MTSSPAVKNLATGLALALLGAATLWATADFATDVPAAADPALLPRLVAAGLILVGAVTMAQALFRGDRAVEAEDAGGLPVGLPVDIPDELRQDDEAAGPADRRQLLGLVAAIVAYSVAAFRLGFATSTVAFIVGAALLLGRDRQPRSLIGLVVFAAAVAAGFYVAFFVLLDVRAPTTPLP